MKKCRKRCLVASRATLPQKWPPPLRNVADSCEFTLISQPKQEAFTAVAAEGGAASAAFAAEDTTAGIDEVAKVLPRRPTLRVGAI